MTSHACYLRNTINFILFPTFLPCQRLQPEPFRTLQAQLTVSQCLGGLSQTNQGRNTTSLIHNVLIHFTCLLRHPRPMIYLQRWSWKTSPLQNTCIHTFINWLKYSVTSQRGMGFPPPSPICFIQFLLLFDKCLMTHYLPRSAALGSFV